MPRKASDPIKAATRRAKAQRRAGADAVCATCERERRPLALAAGSTPMICAACRRHEDGKTTTDKHHVAGEKNASLTVRVPVNDHRAELSEAQYQWPAATLENAAGSPLLAAAGSLRGFTDFMLYLVDNLVEWIVQMLEDLDPLLLELLGPNWWLGTTLERHAP